MGTLSEAGGSLVLFDGDWLLGRSVDGGMSLRKIREPPPPEPTPELLHLRSWSSIDIDLRIDTFEIDQERSG